MANWFATVALLSWPVVAFWLYYTRPVGRATLWTILGAYLLLPVGTSIKFEMIPAFDKSSIPNLAALVGCMLATRRPIRIWNGFGVASILILMFLVGPFITAELNGDAIVYPNRTLPAESHYDALSAVVGQLLFLIPFFLGRQILRGPADNEEILRVLVFAGLCYSLPMLFELRMSPQLHNWVYGYHPHEFVQQVRDGGYRPVVFLGHGLLVSFFAMMTAVAAAAFWRTQTRVVKLPPAGVVAYLGTLLVFCKSLGAIVYGALLVPLVRFSNPRLQFRIAMVLVAVALLYPLLRAADLFPTQSILNTAEIISADRSGSLGFRFNQEDQLLTHASQRLLFGWGRWGRSRVYDEYGNDKSVTDGRWIVTMGQFGLFGFLAEFGLLALSVFRAASALRFTESAPDRVYLPALGLIVAINMVDLLPNASLSPWTWLLAGALLGRAESILALARQHKLGPLLDRRAIAR
jgi:hypothetical protein